MSFVNSGAAELDGAAVRQLVARQFPYWADRGVAVVRSACAGNALFRLGDDLVVRLPRHPGTVAAIDVELRWLPVLAARLPLAVPVPVAVGAPDEVFPHPWMVFRWLQGTNLGRGKEVDEADVHCDSASS